jgi:glyoxylase-like metal-dependent hydrolase (beta-lactamase superfamily II)
MIIKHCLALTLFALAGSMTAAKAAAPQVVSQSAGYYRMSLGDFEVTALSDGNLKLPVDQLFPGTAPTTVQKALAYYYLKAPLLTSVNGYLVNTGSKLVLIDAGTGGLWGKTAGKLLASLKAAGYTPEQVDEIYISHMHGDHIGGLSAAGQRVFPNAIVRAEQQEADYWLSLKNLEKAPDDAKDGFKTAILSLKAYQESGKFQTFDGDVELVPGVHSMVTRGHTPGHSSYVIESKGQKLVVLGDLIHVAGFQLGQPKVAIQFDKDPKRAVEQRARVFDAAVKEGALIAGEHLSFPGLGHLRAKEGGYDWIPVNFENDK